MDERGLYPIYEHWHIPFWQTSLFTTTMWLLLGVLLLILIFFLFNRYYKKSLSSAQRALDELARLGKKDILTIDQAQAAYFELTSILKRFFEQYYKQPYQGMTDMQMIDTLKATDLPADKIALLQETINASSEVKYARQDMMQKQFVQHIGTCVNLIKLLPQPVRVDGALRLAQDKLRECLPAEASAKAGETSPLGSYEPLSRRTEERITDKT